MLAINMIAHAKARVHLHAVLNQKLQISELRRRLIMQAANYAVQNGCLLSRAKVHFFKHNDMKDLERILASVDASERRKKWGPRLVSPSHLNLHPRTRMTDLCSLTKMSIRSFCFRPCSAVQCSWPYTSMLLSLFNCSGQGCSCASCDGHPWCKSIVRSDVNCSAKAAAYFAYCLCRSSMQMHFVIVQSCRTRTGVVISAAIGQCSSYHYII